MGSRGVYSRHIDACGPKQQGFSPPAWGRKAPKNTRKRSIRIEVNHFKTGSELRGEVLEDSRGSAADARRYLIVRITGKWSEIPPLYRGPT